MKLSSMEDITRAVRNTPSLGASRVRSYHEEIIFALDSGEYCVNPGNEHRNTHQAIWMVGYAIYNGIENKSDAYLRFVSSDEDRARFDIWYARKYILEKKLSDWEFATVLRASRASEGRYGHPLFDVTDEDLRI